MSGGGKGWGARLALAAILIVAALHAWQRAFLIDDAFISFRYARHLLEGYGLVYNAGERVEGYTNFLWTLIIAGAMRLGVAPGIAAGGLAVVIYLRQASGDGARPAGGGAGSYIYTWAASALALPAAHLLWRHGYYGEWLPNSFYAKVPGPRLVSGVVYLAAFSWRGIARGMVLYRRVLLP